MFNIPLRVENLILKYDTANPYQLAKCLKFDVFELDLPSEIRGFLVRPLRRKCIVLNANLSELQKRCFDMLSSDREGSIAPLTI